MAKLAFELPPAPTLTIEGSDERFPVNRIYCVGKNYAAHAREMGRDEREPPFFFMKPANAAVDAASPVELEYPAETSNYHYELELVAVLGASLRDASEEEAIEAILGYAVGLDMTRRDLQLAAREKGRPWELGKSFSRSAPIGAIHRAKQWPDSEILLEVNGEVRQQSQTSMMLWGVAESLAFLSKFDTLEAGDVLMTGTPAGVGAVGPRDGMVGRITGLTPINVIITGAAQGA
ncbi:fumarylacetoacetate hydrolase family protein [Pelagerythrobacter aerophilus]